MSEPHSHRGHQNDDHDDHAHGHHEEEPVHEYIPPKGDVTFEFEEIHYQVSAEAATNSGLVGKTDRIQLPGGQLILLHPHEGMVEPHAHADDANSVTDIQAKGGKVWQAELA